MNPERREGRTHFFKGVIWICSQEGVSTWQAVSRLLRGVPEDVLTLLPKEALLTSIAQHERKLFFGDDLNPRDQTFHIPPEYLLHQHTRMTCARNGVKETLLWNM